MTHQAPGTTSDSLSWGQRVRWRCAVLAGLAAALTACQSKQKAQGDQAQLVPVPWEVPADFSLDLTIVAQVAEEQGAAQVMPLEMRPGRFVVFADGALHHTSEPSRGPWSLPPLVRILTDDQVDQLWHYVRTSGLGEPADGAPVGNLLDIEPPDEGVGYFLVISAIDQRWMQGEVITGDQIGDEAYGQLAQRLGWLAWLPETKPRDRRRAVRRYDFGPDPYARYRQE